VQLTGIGGVAEQIREGVQMGGVEPRIHVHCEGLTRDYAGQ
jgi:hypothetical protein